MKTCSPIIVYLMKAAMTILLFCGLTGAQHLTSRYRSPERAKRQELVVLAKVIGVEEPEQGWIMHYQAVKIFYLKIVKKLSGREKSSFIKVAYGYHPSHPEQAPPTDLFDGKSIWKFHLSRLDMWDGKVEVSRRVGRLV